MERKHYIDQLRLFCILLLVPYHVAMAYNCWEESNYIISGSSKILSSFVVFISPWFMGVLFLLAGISASYSLKKRTIKEFVLERVHKLFVPLVFGTIFLIPILTYIANITNCFFVGNYFSHLKLFFTRWTDLSGFDGGFTIAHLWFLLCLFVISLVALFIHIICKHKIGKIKNRLWITILLIYGSSLLLPIKLGGKSIVMYLAFYLIGQYIFADDTIIDKLMKKRRYLIFVALWLISSFANIYLFIWKDYQVSILLNIINSIASGSGIFSLLVLFKIYFNRTTKLTTFLTSISFPFYIVHFIFVVIFEYYLSMYITNIFLIFMIATILAILASLVTSTIIKYCPILNLCFGCKRKGKKVI